MKKVKTIIYYIIPLLFSVYGTYLVDRIWDLTIGINIMTGSILGIIFYYIFYIFHKKIDYKEINKKKLFVSLLIALILTTSVLVGNFDFFTKTYTESTVVLSMQNQNNEESEKIPVKAILLDKIDQNLVNHKDLNPITLSFDEKYKDIIIVFETNKDNGIVTIKDGNTEKKIDLYSYKDGILKYEVESNKTMGKSSFVRLILSFIMIELLSYMFVLSVIEIYRKDRSIFLVLFFIIAVIQMMFYKECVPYTIYPDTFSYQMTEIFTSKLQDRTPIYPMIIHMFESICGKSLWMYYLVYAQIIVSYLSVIFMYKILKLLIKNNYLIYFVTFLYGISNAVLGWNSAILTESLSLSFTVFLVYNTIVYLKSNKLRFGICGIIISLVITFLKPACIIYPVILFLFFILKLIVDKDKRKNDFKCFASSSIVCMIILIYAVIFYNQNKIFSISKASLRQNLYVCMHEGFYLNSGDEEFINNVNKSVKYIEDPWIAMCEILESYNEKDIQKLIKKSKLNSKVNYIKYISNLVVTYTRESFNSYYKTCIDNDINLANVCMISINFLNFGIVYILIIAEAVVFVYKLLFRHKVDWINLGLCGFLCAILFTSFVGTNGEFMRTAICVVPFSYIAIGTLINDIKEKTITD